MVGLLDGGMVAIFGAGLGWLYPDGFLHRDGTDPVYDDEANITGYSSAAAIPCKVQRDKATYAMRQAEGYSEGDVMLIVLAEGLSVEIPTDYRISDGQGIKWMVQSAELDAAGSHWICRGRRA